MNIIITGGTGFIGSQLTKFLLKKNKVTILSRKNVELKESTRVIQSLNQIKTDEKIDVIINLAGTPISKRWTDSYKKTLINSRLKVTKDIISLIKSLKTKPNLLISASAIGYYGSQYHEHITEDSYYINDFTHELCDLWELEAKKASDLGVRTCIARLGVVLGKNGGALKEMLPAFKLCLGGKLGSGKQFFSWVHLDDVINIFDFLISNKKQEGTYNLTSPAPISNAEFTNALSKVLNRPAYFNMPKFMIKILFGEMGEKLLLSGAAVYPQKLLDNGYEFKFKTIENALESIIK